MNSEDRVVDLLEELVKWTKVMSIPKVRTVLEEILQTPEERVAYQQSDGKPSKEIAELANVSYVTVTKWWKRWIKAGVAEPISARGGERARRVFSLEDFGLEIPSLGRVNTETEQEKGGG